MDSSDFGSPTSTSLLCTPHTSRRHRDKVPSLTENLAPSKVGKMVPRVQGTSSLRSPTPMSSPQTPARDTHDGQGWFSQLGQGVVTPMSTRGKMGFAGSNTSSPASVTKRNVKGETLLHVAAIKVSLLLQSLLSC